MTMQKIVGSSHAAKPTIGTMIWLFLVGHPQVANIAVIGSKLRTARYAAIGFTALTSKALATYNFRHRKSINVVVIVLRNFRQ